MSKRVAVVGTGPAGLMAASILAKAGIAVTIFEKNKGPGHKLLIAGGSGLNVSNALPPEEFAAHYSGDIRWIDLFEKFSVADWLAFIHTLGLETFEGTSGRYFVREMKASGLLRLWLEALEKAGAVFHYNAECTGWEKSNQKISLHFRERASQAFDAVLFALGGGSWLKEEARWPEIFKAHGVSVLPFRSANAGFSVAWRREFIAEAANQPLKNITFHSALGHKKGDLMITEYGLEGTPVYFYGASGDCSVDLKPDHSETEIAARLDSVRENLSPLRRAAKKLHLDKAALALLFHHAPPETLASNTALAHAIKNFPLVLGEPRPLTEAISSLGGIRLDEIDTDFQLRKIPGVYAAGEMLDWHAPTGGFLIQACVSQGFAAAKGILKYSSA